MKPPRRSLSLPVRMAVPVVALGGLCTVGLGVWEYTGAVRAEREALQHFVRSAGPTASSISTSEARASHELAERLAGLTGYESVADWRLLDGQTGDEQLRSPGSQGFDFEQFAALDHAVVWTPGPGGDERIAEAVLRDRVVLRLPAIHEAGPNQTFVAVIDGPTRHRAVLGDIAKGMVPTVAGFAILALLVFASTYRWISRPIAVLQSSLVSGRSEADTFDAEHNDEPVEIPGLFGRVQSQIFEDQQTVRLALEAIRAMAEASPVALLSIDREGVIRDSNRAAGRLLTGGDRDNVVGQAFVDLVAPADRPTLANRWTTDANDVGEASDIRLCRRPDDSDDDPAAEVSVAIGRFDPHTGQASVVLQPRTRGDGLRDRLARQQRLLQSAIDGLDRPWALTDAEGRVQLANRAWVGRTGQSTDTLIQSDLGRDALWAAWGETSAAKAAAVIADTLRGASVDETETRIDTPDGSCRIEGSPVSASSATGEREAQGFAWTIRADTDLETIQGRDALDKTVVVDTAYDAVFSDLREARTTHDLLDAAVEAIRKLTGAPAAGVAVRAADPTGRRRSEQRLSVGGTSVPLRSYADLRGLAESELMPTVMGSSEAVVAIADTEEGDAWTDALRTCGFGDSVGVQLNGLGELLGVLWVAERPGRSLSPSSFERLTRAAELIGARLDALRLGESFEKLGLLDPVTGLPTTPALVRHLQTVPTPEDFTTPNHLLVFTIEPTALDALSATARDAFAVLAADCLRARCRRNVFIAATGPGEFAVSVHAMGAQ
ncbi:MAG: PAS domain S-box protein, partial [Planctomycetota bacterium]